MTRRRIGLLITLALGLLVAPLAADAQPLAKVGYNVTNERKVPQRFTVVRDLKP